MSSLGSFRKDIFVGCNMECPSWFPRCMWRVDIGKQIRGELAQVTLRRGFQVDESCHISASAHVGHVYTWSGDVGAVPIVKTESSKIRGFIFDLFIVYYCFTINYHAIITKPKTVMYSLLLCRFGLHSI